MAYAGFVGKLVKKYNVRPGDRIKVTADKEYEGLLMPRIDLADDKHIVLKLDNGYNIGVTVAPETRVAVIERHSPPKVSKAELAPDKNLPNVHVIATGGTISSKIEYRTGGVIASIDPADLVQAVPEIGRVANLTTESPFQEMSENLHWDHWKAIAEAAAKALKKADGVIVTHGTDTMAVSSAALSFMLPNLQKPVVLTGAQRSSDRGSCDSFMNLLCSTRAAVGPVAGVGICMHGTTNDDYCLFHRGTKVRKMHTSRRDAFRSINDFPLARIFPDGKYETLNANHVQRGRQVQKADTKYDPKVALIKTFPNFDGEIIEALIDRDYHGIVLEGTGLGHIPTNAGTLGALERAQSEEIPIVITSQCLYGRVNQYVYTNLRELWSRGVIGGEDMLPETAFVKLGWVLGHTRRCDKVRELMQKNLAGEITGRTEPLTYLI